MISAMREVAKVSPVLRSMVIATTGVFFASIGAQAQPATAAANAAKIPVVAATASPAVGEEVLDSNGSVTSAEFLENRTCNMRGCRSFIFDMRSGALISVDRVWAPAYAPTGRGGQVIRVLPFVASERPGPTPSDAALDTAPAIVKVTRAPAAATQKPPPK